MACAIFATREGAQRVAGGRREAVTGPVFAA
jgi:hypothetical protein